VLLIAKDRQCAELPPGTKIELERTKPRSRDVDPGLVQRAARLLRAGRTMLVAGDEVSRSGAQTELARLATTLDALVCTTPDARDAFSNHSGRFLGVSGAMGTAAVAQALAAAHTCLLVGTRLPLLARQGLEPILADKQLIAVGHEPPFVGPGRALHVCGDVLGALRALNAELGTVESAEPPWRSPSPQHSGSSGRFSMRAALAVLERKLPQAGVVLVDAGNTGAAAAHQLRLPPKSRWLLAMGMAGMGYAFGAAVGAALATGERCTVVAGDGAFFMHGLDVHTAVEHALPITYVVFDNRAHGMCLVRERLFLHENAGHNTFAVSHLGAGLGAMFPGLLACDCRSEGEFESALERARQARGPAFIGVEFDDVEIPPFAAFDAVNEEGALAISRGVSRARD
jgi:acetolactate synthase-1/2/3 large subunit